MAVLAEHITKGCGARGSARKRECIVDGCPELWVWLNTLGQGQDTLGEYVAASDGDFGRLGDGVLHSVCVYLVLDPRVFHRQTGLLPTALSVADGTQRRRSDDVLEIGVHICEFNVSDFDMGNDRQASDGSRSLVSIDATPEAALQQLEACELV